MIMADLQKFIDELRAKVSIADVVGEKVKLVRKGREYTGLCPFHNEKTPSFTVNEAKGFYHCFGCGAHGDIVKFEMDANNLPFMEALEKLAHKAGLEMPRLSHENKVEVEKRKSLYEIMELAVKFFERNLRLPEGQQALDYLRNRRGFSEETITKFHMGYAPANNGLRAWLASKNVSEQDMGDLGLVSLAEHNTSKRTFDFFRDRVMIPIFDKAGRPIAFGGRVMSDAQPKYLNSPETPIFQKRRILYNMNYARDKAFEAKNLLICEGYMDVIALDAYGIGYAVAPLGTALTEDQIQETWRVCPEPVCCFDGDGAGIRAAMRSVDRVLPILKPGYSLRFLFLPDKQDPDEFLKAKGQGEFLKLLENETKPLKDILWRKYTENQVFNTPEKKALLEKTMKDEAAKIADETVRNYYIQDLQSRLYYEIGRGAKSPYRSEFLPRKSQKSRTYYADNNPGLNVTVVHSQKVLDEAVVKFVLAAMIYCPSLIAEYEEKLSTFEIKNPELKKLFDALVEIAAELENADFASMMEVLSQKGCGDTLKNLWEVQMLKTQKADELKLRDEIKMKIIEVQLQQLEAEIRECLRLLETADAFSDEVYKRYESLKKEKEQLLNEQDAV